MDSALMAGTKEGGTKMAAFRAGCSVDEYRRRVADGLKRCTGCKLWHPVADFRVDQSRWDGLAAICTACRRPPRQLPLLKRTRPEYERARYASDATYRTERRRRVHARKRGIDPMPIEG